QRVSHLREHGSQRSSGQFWYAFLASSICTVMLLTFALLSNSLPGRAAGLAQGTASAIGGSSGSSSSNSVSADSSYSSECTLCNLSVRNVTISCNPDGSVHWSATVYNNATCT